MFLLYHCELQFVTQYWSESGLVTNQWLLTSGYYPVFTWQNSNDYKFISLQVYEINRTLDALYFRQFLFNIRSLREPLSLKTNFLLYKR